MNDYDLDQLGFDELALLLRQTYENSVSELAEEIAIEICKRIDTEGVIK